MPSLKIWAQIYLASYPTEGYEGYMAIFENEETETMSAVTFYPSRGCTAEIFIDEMMKHILEYDGLPIGNVSFSIKDLDGDRSVTTYSILCQYSELDLPLIQAAFEDTMRDQFGELQVFSFDEHNVQ